MMDPQKMPETIRKALDDFWVEVEILNQDHADAVKNQNFEAAASLRERSENLKIKHEEIMRDWRENAQ